MTDMEQSHPTWRQWDLHFIHVINYNSSFNLPNFSKCFLDEALKVRFNSIEEILFKGMRGFVYEEFVVLKKKKCGLCFS
ncbi:hypothetical protein RDI58_025193 [Solanum bulbocastanum]|uniref:Uncharacterized protein n=1 Tax=Solanum bulbocastanum TaxID=147425 RepID=A0AAN8SZ15_SOLBU